MNKWSVHVKEFGKIEEATVEVAPMTLFIGDNNSGKSYMMTLIYGLLNMQFFFGGYDFDTESENFQRCWNILERMIDGEQDYDYILSEQELVFFEALINEMLANQKNREKFLHKLFNRDMEMEELTITFPKDLELRFRVAYIMDEEGMGKKILIKGILDDGTLLSGYQIGEQELQNGDGGDCFLISYIMERMLQWELDKGDVKTRVYLPTARTGFLLTYKTLIGNALQEKFTTEKTTKNLLTKPNSDFLQELSGINATEEKSVFRVLLTS